MAWWWLLWAETCSENSILKNEVLNLTVDLVSNLFSRTVTCYLSLQCATKSPCQVVGTSDMTSLFAWHFQCSSTRACGRFIYASLLGFLRAVLPVRTAYEIFDYAVGLSNLRFRRLGHKAPSSRGEVLCVCVCVCVCVFIISILLSLCTLKHHIVGGKALERKSSVS
jgi:hypothetical protein